MLIAVPRFLLKHYSTVNRQAEDAIWGKAWRWREKTHASCPSTSNNSSKQLGSRRQHPCNASSKIANGPVSGELRNQSCDRTQEKYRISCWWRNDRLITVQQKSSMGRRVHLQKTSGACQKSDRWSTANRRNTCQPPGTRCYSRKGSE
jgi:hypothetical protein